MPGMGSSLRAAALLAFVVLSILVSLLISSVQQFGARVSHSSGAAALAVHERESALMYQLNERRKEILPLLLPRDAADAGQPGRGRSPEPTSEYNLWNEIAHGSRRARMDEMDCDSLVDMQAVEVLGSGYTKLVVKVNLADGRPVALKLVNEQGIDMGKCVEDFQDPQGCRQLVSYKLQKEIVLLQRLQHPNVIKVKLPRPGQTLSVVPNLFGLLASDCSKMGMEFNSIGRLNFFFFFLGAAAGILGGFSTVLPLFTFSFVSNSVGCM